MFKELWFNASYVKRHLPTTVTEGFQSPIHVITGQRARLAHMLPFRSLVYFAVDKQHISDPKFDPRAQAAVYLGQRVSKGRKCVKGGNKGHKGRVIYSTNIWILLSSCSEKEEERGKLLCLEEYSCLERNNWIKKYLFNRN